MKDFFRKSFLFSIGAANVTREKLEAMVDTLIKQGQAREEERVKLIEEWMQKAEEMRSELAQIVQNVLLQMDLPTRQEFEELQNRIEKLEAQIAQLTEVASK